MINLPQLITLVGLVQLSRSEGQCADLYPRHCRKWERQGYCSVTKYKPSLQKKCRKSCNFCEEATCYDMLDTSRCEEWLNLGLCEEGSVSEMCAYTCGTCATNPKCPMLSIKDGYFTSDGEQQNESNMARTDISGVIDANTMVKIQCKSGFQLMGAGTVTCQSDGQYDGELGVCVRNNECEVPTYGTSYKKLDRYFLVSEPMSHNINTVSPGTYAILVCTNGRKQQSFCSGFGTWLPPLRDCDDDNADWDRWYQEDVSNLSKRHMAGTSIEE